MFTETDENCLTETVARKAKWLPKMQNQTQSMTERTPSIPTRDEINLSVIEQAFTDCFSIAPHRSN